MNKMYAIANITGITVPPPPTPPSIIGTIYVVFDIGYSDNISLSGTLVGWKAVISMGSSHEQIRAAVQSATSLALMAGPAYATVLPQDVAVLGA